MSQLPHGARGSARRLGSKLELGLLVVGLLALAFGAGAVGWAIAQGSESTRTVTVGAVRPSSTQTQTTSSAPAGDPTAGKAVFVNAGCGSCHTLAATGAKGTVGPNLDQVKLTVSQILDWVAKGKGGMPSFKAQLTPKQLADVSAFVAKAESSR